jgi:hypothetical protein
VKKDDFKEKKLKIDKLAARAGTVILNTLMLGEMEKKVVPMLTDIEILTPL